MPTPDFEDWMERQDFDVQDTKSKERYQNMMADQYGFKSEAQQKIIGEQYERKYEVQDRLGIRSIDRKYEYRGEPYVETRYVITGLPGLWGPASAMKIAAERLEAGRETELAKTYWARYQDAIEAGPKRSRRGATE